jgi:hypothetical protein
MSSGAGEPPHWCVYRYEAGLQTERWRYPDDLAAWERIFHA